MSIAENSPGKVLIVGAGPGASDLITVKGLRALRQADIVFYDALVNPQLLSETDEAAEKVFVGKRCGRHALDQREINRWMVFEAQAGKTVVRLKGGDPLVFGRGGEEALACEEAGIEFELIPGVSSALGAASYAGIPLTHRGIASSVAFITAREGRENESGQNKLASLAKAADTLVIFMGGSRLRSIVKSLIGAGLSASTPVAVISEATLHKQQTIVAKLSTIAEQVARARLTTPMLIIVGEVAYLSTALNWFERQRRAVPAIEPDAPAELILLQWPE
ncbi:MAG: uroporphyrinogen-III C-methyltransferase [Acidobacteriia bacterium]|nr:uroporphyrinogen-III C-methyltransferase [Terriglobia bacterium]